MKYLKKLESFEQTPIIPVDEIQSIFQEIEDDRGLKVNIYIDPIIYVDIFLEYDVQGYYLHYEEEEQEEEPEEDEEQEESIDESGIYTTMELAPKSGLNKTNPINWSEIYEDLATAVDRLNDYSVITLVKVFTRNTIGRPGVLSSFEYDEVPEDISLSNFCAGIRVYIKSVEKKPIEKRSLIQRFKDYFS